MQFTKLHRICCIFSLTAALAACSSSSDKALEAAHLNNAGHASTQENSYVIDIEDLLSQSNRYLDHQKSVSAAIRSDFDLALKARKSGQLDEAETAFIQLTVREPDLSGPWVQLGDIAKERAQHALTIQQREQLLEKAAAQYHQALSINESNYYGHNRLATVYRQQGQFNLALVHYQKAIESWPAFAAAYKNRGILYDLYIGDKAKALENYQIYLALNNEKVKTTKEQMTSDTFAKKQRQIRGWIADLTRQIQQQSKQNNQQQTQVVNNAL